MYLDDVFHLLTQLVGNVYEAHHSFQPGDGMSRQTLNGLSEVILSSLGRLDAALNSGTYLWALLASFCYRECRECCIAMKATSVGIPA